MSAPTREDVRRFVRDVLVRAGVSITTFSDGTIGLLNVQPRGVAVIDALHQALVSVAAGDGLPELAPLEPEKPSRKRKAVRP